MSLVRHSVCPLGSAFIDPVVKALRVADSLDMSDTAPRIRSQHCAAE